MIHSFVNLSSVRPGFNADRVLTFQVPLPNQRYTVAALKTFSEDLVAAIRRLPSVESAAYAHQLPMVKLRQIAGFRRTPALPNPPNPMQPEVRFVSRDYFAVMGIHVISGRGFREEDGPGKPGVLVINQTLVRREFSGENPIGQTVYLGSDTNGLGVGPALGGGLWDAVGPNGLRKKFGLMAPKIFDSRRAVARRAANDGVSSNRRM